MSGAHGARVVVTGVAGFIGSPGMNFFEGRVESSNGTPVVMFGDGQRLAIDDAERELAGGLEGREGGSVVVGVRPEHLEDASLATSTPESRRLRGLVRLRELLGSELVVHFEVEAAPVVTDETRDLAEDVDASALTELDHLRAARRTSFVGRFAAEETTEEDTVAEIAVAPAALRFFDRETGARDPLVRGVLRRSLRLGQVRDSEAQEDEGEEDPSDEEDLITHGQIMVADVLPDVDSTRPWALCQSLCCVGCCRAA